MWTTLLENPKAITALFEREPSLVDVTLLSVLIEQGGPTVTLALGLNDFPPRPPERWRRSKADAVVLYLELLAVRNVHLDGWSTDTRISVSVETADPEGIVVRIRNSMISLACECGWIRVKSVHPYKRTTQTCWPQDGREQEA